MSAFYILISLVVEGVTWAACIFCLLRVAKKIGDNDFRRWIHWLSPMWAGASLLLVVAYSIEAFIAVCGISEYEGFSFTRQGAPLSQSSVFVRISLSVVFYLLPAILLSRKARQSFAVIYSITGLCFLSNIAVPRFEKAEPIQSTTAQRASRVADY